MSFAPVELPITKASLAVPATFKAQSGRASLLKYRDTLPSALVVCNHAFTSFEDLAVISPVVETVFPAPASVTANAVVAVNPSAENFLLVSSAGGFTAES